MMESFRIPVLIIRDDLGQSTAMAIGADEHAVAVAPTEGQAVRRVADYLQWQLKRDTWIEAPDLIEAQLTSFRVTIRPEYREDRRIYPCPETLTLDVPCVYGKQTTGLFYASLPLQRISFYYYESTALQELATRYAQESLKGMTPRQLAGFLPPTRMELRPIVVSAPPRRRRPQYVLTARQLPLVSDAIGDRQLRSQFRQAWERDELVESLVRLLNSRRQNLLLVGDAGVGKTTLLASAIRQLGRDEPQPPVEEIGEKPPVSQRYWLTSGARLIAGMKYLGEWEQRCERIIAELADLGRVLCVENLRELLEAGGNPEASVGSFLVPYLQRGEVQLIAECTPAELTACRRLLPNLVDVFQIVNVPRFDRRRAVAVLERLLSQLKQQYRLESERGVTDLTERLFHRFLPYEVFPGSTLTFLTDVFASTARTVTATTQPPGSPVVTTEMVLDHFIRRTGLPASLLRDEQTLDHAETVSHFEQRVIGQPVACVVAADLVTTFKAGLNDPSRPVASLLFCGPTGVGKTEMAKAIADEFFGHGEQRDRLVRLDMSEYSGYDAAYRLVTQADGEPSPLIQTLRRQPLSVVLFDEIEKAAPDVFDVLLGLLDEGRLTDPFGRVTDFRCAIVIMTSNLGAERQQSIGFERKAAASYEQEVRNFFRPEFFNRLTDVVTFEPLDASTALKIAQREIQLLSRREGLVRRSLHVVATPAVCAAVAQRGFDQRYGARPLQRTVEQDIAGPLAQWLLSHTVPPGHTIRVDWDPLAAKVRFET